MDAAWIEHESVETMIHVGLVMTNQQRKDWGLAAAICAGLAERLQGEVRFWWHSDLETRHWSLPALVADFQLGELVEITHPPVDDAWLAERYRKCDVTILPSSGEGFGYTIFESLACGTPCIHGDYAGGASIMRTCGLEYMLVPPREWCLSEVHNCIRPVYRPDDFVAVAMQVLEQHKQMEIGREQVAQSVQHLAWSKLGHTWKRWLREGL